MFDCIGTIRLLGLRSSIEKEGSLLLEVGNGIGMMISFGWAMTRFERRLRERERERGHT